MTAALVAASATVSATARPVGWRALARVLWFERRGALLGIAMLLGAFAVAVAIGELQVAGAYHRYVAAGCLEHAISRACAPGPNSLRNDSNYVSAIRIAADGFPVLIGAFLGAPLLARAYESGTFRFTWTQAVGRRRYLVATTTVLVVVVAVVGLLVGLLVDWISHPFQAVQLASQWQPGLFDAAPLVLAAWSVLGLLLGLLVGAVIGRTVAAMAASAVVLGGLAVGATVDFVPRLLSISPTMRSGVAPITNTGALNQASWQGNGPPDSWLVRAWVTGPRGSVLNNTQVMQLTARMYKAGVYKGYVTRKSPATWLSTHHYTYFLAYQPADRFWIFQLGAVVVLLAVAALAAVLAVRVVHRRGA